MSMAPDLVWLDWMWPLSQGNAGPERTQEPATLGVRLVARCNDTYGAAAALEATPPPFCLASNAV